MALTGAEVYKNRILVSCVVTGTANYATFTTIGTYNAAGITAFADTNRIVYSAWAVDTNGNPTGTDWEVGVGVVGTTGTVITRADAEILASSNAGARVSWAASSTVRIAVVDPAETKTAGGDLTGSYPFPSIGAGKVTNAMLAGSIDLTTKVAGQLPTTNGGMPTGAIQDFAGYTVPTGWLLCDGSAVSRATYATLFAALSKTATITVTIASPGVVTWTAHGLSDGDPVFFTTTGALPTGITASTVYYVRSSTTNTFQLAATVGGAAINTSGSQSGTHTGQYLPWGSGDGSTTFNVPDLRGRTAIGSGTGTSLTARNLAASSGTETHTLVDAELPSHTHGPSGTNTGFVMYKTGGTISLNTAAGGNTYPGATVTGSTGSDTAHNNMQPYKVVTKIIKT